MNAAEAKKFAGTIRAELAAAAEVARGVMSKSPELARQVELLKQPLAGVAVAGAAEARRSTLLQVTGELHATNAKAYTDLATVASGLVLRAAVALDVAAQALAQQEATT